VVPLNGRVLNGRSTPSGSTLKRWSVLHPDALRGEMGEEQGYVEASTSEEQLRDTAELER